MVTRQNSFTFLQGENASYLEEMYEVYKSNPEELEETWQNFFKGYELGQGALLQDASASSSSTAAHVEAYINAYRRLGHMNAKLNPLGDKSSQQFANLNPEAHGLGGVDKNEKFKPANIVGMDEASLSDIDALLHKTYCEHIGADFREINNIEIVEWLQEKMEACQNKPEFNQDVLKRISQKLAESEGLEKFLQARFLGQKRFSLEGLEALVPLMDRLIQHGAELGVDEVCVGMAHRGRLNVLANVFGKSPEKMLKEFEDSEYESSDIEGDVKYHLGFASKAKTGSQKEVTLVLMPNPSHLEAINPVVEGFARARQSMVGDHHRKKVIPVLIHGDAAVVGQGVVSETFNLAELGSFTTGGTVHVITNNQIGFTTEPSDYRSSHYSSGIAKVIRAPVIHVNADNPEAVVWAATLAIEYRQKFGRDIVIDLIGYRRHGHNETDEPSYTQPSMYQIISKHPTVHTKFKKSLVERQVMTEADLKAADKEIRARWQHALDQIRSENYEVVEQTPPKELKSTLEYVRVDKPTMFKTVETGVSKKVLTKIATAITRVPKSFTPLKKLNKLLDSRNDMFFKDSGIDWPMAELLAFGSLAVDGHHVRLSGQDCRRGTFSSRHGVWRDTSDNKRYEPLNQIASGQAEVSIIDSPLSEAAVVGFEFGYSIAHRGALVLWEAQFGDFVNGAQIIIDQFLSASESKWKQTSKLVFLLPHGHEGMGPEHSSGRPERFLQLCGNLNMQVAIPTTAAQYFHILRRQIVRKDVFKPLIIMSPKSLLRDSRVASKVSEFEKGEFLEVLEDKTVVAKKAKRVVFCSGKIYYDLMELREKKKLQDSVALMRIEQLYPFPADQVREHMAPFKKVEVVWCQEEPRNMGSWSFIADRLRKTLDRNDIEYHGRKRSGTTAEGSKKAHQAEQQRIIHEALGLKFEK